MSEKETPTIFMHQIACHECDLLQQAPDLAEGETAHCIRCEAVLFRNKTNSVDRSLAFALAGLIFYMITNAFPLISLKALGFVQDGTLLSTSLSLFSEGMPLLSILLFFTTIVFPLTTLLGTIYILMQVKHDRFNDYTAPIFRFLRSTETWGMLEIFMLAVLVSMVKLGDFADVIFGVSLYSFVLLILSLTLMSLSLNPQDVWSKLRSELEAQQSEAKQKDSQQTGAQQ